MPLTDDGARAFADAHVAALGARIYVVEEKAFTDAYPDRQPTRMTVKFRDGGTREPELPSASSVKATIPARA